MIEIVAIQPADLQKAWADALPFVEAAITKQIPILINADYLQSLCREGEALLLMVIQDGLPIGCGIIQEELFPLARVCWNRCTSGEEGDLWLDKMDETIHNIARLNKCDYVMSWGRKGWERRKPDYAVGLQIYYKEVT